MVSSSGGHDIRVVETLESDGVVYCDTVGLDL